MQETYVGHVLRTLLGQSLKTLAWQAQTFVMMLLLLGMQRRLVFDWIMDSAAVRPILAGWMGLESIEAQHLRTLMKPAIENHVGCLMQIEYLHADFEVKFENQNCSCFQVETEVVQTLEVQQQGWLAVVQKQLKLTDFVVVLVAMNHLEAYSGSEQKNAGNEALKTLQQVVDGSRRLDC